MIPPTVTVIIVTRNRAKHLDDCLKSLTNQSIKPSAIIVINNNSTDHTSKTIKQYSTQLKIKEVIENKIGRVYARNCGLKTATSEWIAFLDDDCVAQSNWYASILKSISQHNKKNLVAILGFTSNYYPQNLYACAVNYDTQLWIQSKLDHSNHVKDFTILDTRNLLLNLNHLNRKQLTFNTELHHLCQNYSNEDCEMGLTLQRHHLKAIYDNTIIAFHKEPRSWTEYWQRYFSYKQNWEKWQAFHGQTYQPHSRRLNPEEINQIFNAATQKLNKLDTAKFLLLTKSYHFLWKFKLHLN